MLKEKEYTINMKVFNSINITSDIETEKIDNKIETIIFDENFIKELKINQDIFYNNDLIKKQAIQKNRILNLIKESENEWGCISEFEEFLINNKSDKFLINMINEIFIDNIHDEDVIVKILHAFSKLNYKDTYPNAQTMCLAAISINNTEIKEAAIEVFESWRNSEALKLLQIIDIKEIWLKKYCEEIINEIKEELGNV
ncbi:MAG: hypothetical protein IKG42_03335 [Clostridia bacterium]|nr:hypothetical protein [Clostridia bacterium]